MRLLALIIISILLSLSGAAASEVSTVKEVDVEGLSSIGREELLYLLDIERGRPIEPKALRDGIKRAFLKGIFDEISVEEDELSPGTIKITVKEREIIEKISVRGNNRLSKKFILLHDGLSEGDAVYGSSIEGLKRAVADKGFPSAAINLKIEGTRVPYRVNAVIEIEEGEPLVLSGIDIIGRQTETARRFIGLRPGDIYDQLKLRSDIERLSDHFKRLGYLSPAVGPYTFKDGVLHLNVEPGARLIVSIKGNKVVSSRTLKKVMPFIEAGDVRDDLVEEAVKKMASIYNGEGYPFVQIAPLVSRGEDAVALNFYVFEGERVRVGKINFTGATIPPESLRAILSLREGGPYDPNLIDSDIETINGFYFALGYVDASVEEPEVIIEGSKAQIDITISEGARVEVSEVAMEGVKSIPEGEVLAAIKIKPGEPFNEVDLSDARRRVLSLYRSRGYQKCEVDIVRDIDGAKARVTFKVDEGPQQFFGKTIIAGNSFTKPVVVSRELLYTEGMALDDTLLARSRQRLYKLNLFSDIDMKLLNEKGDTADVLVKVREGRPGTFEFGFGYGEYERYRGFFDISYRNLFGMNRQLSFRTEMSTIENRYILSYYEPWFIGRPIPMRAFLIREEREEKNIDTGETRYRLTRHTASAGIQKKVTERVRFDIFYEFSLTETFDVQPDVILSKDDAGTLTISSVTPSISFDSRDDPFDPQKGVFAGLSAKTATYVLLSETDFVKLTAHLNGYERLFRWLVAAVSLRGGVAEGYRGTGELPLVERFFLGGRNTVRGFNQDSIGPVGELGTPIGGDVFALGNLELRLRMTKSLRLVGFIDAGNVWSRPENVDLGDLRSSAGAGIRYGTPVGPVRIDYGLKLDQRPGESQGEMHFSLGHAF